MRMPARPPKYRKRWRRPHGSTLQKDDKDHSTTKCSESNVIDRILLRNLKPKRAEPRSSSMTMLPTEPSRMAVLADRCLTEPPSRALDVEIYCAIHGIEDGNTLASPALVEARAKGDVLIVEPGMHGWVEVPPFTAELKYARSLLPDGLYTVSSEPRIVCATALHALVITNAPPLPHLSLRSEQWA
jgi:hypothetical protein